MVILAACSHSADGSASSTRAVDAPESTASPVEVGRTALGDVLVDADGQTLYGFTDDTDGTSTCEGACATVWPPLKVPAGFTPNDTMNPPLHTVTRTNGDLQLAVGKWPLYVYTGDHAAGDTNGQGFERFFVVRPDGTLANPASATSRATAAPSVDSSY
jgi:predicted lipoprotein with Yx(FWY)xxD motif